MWIFCCGAKRSGSTLQYNIAARVVELSGRGIRVPYCKPEQFSTIKHKYQNDHRIKVFKSHALTDEIKNEITENNAKILYSYRDIRDVVVSAIDQNWIEKNVLQMCNFAQSYINDYNIWTTLKGQILVRRYEDFVQNLENEIKIISEYIQIKISSDIIKQIARELNYENLKSHLKSKRFETVNEGTHVFDKDTLLHTDHIRNVVPKQYVKRLNAIEVLNIESRAYSWLQENNYELHWPNTDKFLSHSQHGDDYIAWQLLGRKRRGLAIEIGAFDGMHLSNSYSLAQLGWKTICIEPNPLMYSFLKKKRPESVNINCAVVSDPSINNIVFYKEKIGVLSGVTFDREDVKARYLRRGLKYEEPEEIKVKAKTLTRIFEENQIEGDEVDIISIDVEGFEMEVLKGFDFEKYTPKLFIIEANSDIEKQRIVEYFACLGKKYVFLGSNYQNLFFLHYSLLKRRLFKNLNTSAYHAATQYHPIDNDLAIQSVKPSLKINYSISKVPRIFSFLKFR